MEGGSGVIVPHPAADAGRPRLPAIDHRALFDGAPVAQAAISPDGRLVAVNPAFCRLAARGEAELVGQPFADVLCAGDVQRLSCAVAALRAGEVATAELEAHMLRPAGQAAGEAGLLLSAIRGPGGVVECLAVTVIDLREQRQAEERLIHRALHDSLTGLPNRECFLTRLDAAIRRLGRRPGTLALLFLDLDRFKVVNDSLGHSAGDLVLLEVAHRLRDVVRGTDMVARLGGDEFTILCEDVAGDGIPVRLAERVLDHLAAPMRIEGREITLSASLGIAIARDVRDAQRDLMRDADLALYRAKDRGRARVEIFQPSMRTPAVTRLDEAESLRRALGRGELRVHYQPDVGLADGAVAGVEALLRWERRGRGLVPPAEFIGLAEETGDIVEIGAWVLAQACREMASWPASGPRGPLPVSVNLSARQLAAPQLVDTIRDTLAATGLEPGRLVLEITESVLMDDVGASLAVLGDLRALGVRVAIDDFGTGYSSLSYLRRFPVDLVKIDRSFTAGLGHDPAADAIVAAVVNLSHALGLEVVAEGVETEEQVVALRGLRCDRGQGHYWSPALAPESLIAVQDGIAPHPAQETLVDLRPLLAARAQVLRAQTRRPVLLELPGDLAPVIADAAGVRTILDQLLANAVAYSDEGRPVLISAATDRRRLRVSVSDFGIGMSAEQAARCFEQFWQAEPGGRGSGIGLYIVRSLVEAMGGHVGVRTTRGKGTTVSFTLPRAGSRRAQRAAAPGVGERSVVREFKRQLGIVTGPDA